MHIKRFNESIDYSSYHTISDDEIGDIALEMTDNGFSIEINRYFLNSDGTKTKQPTSDICTPIYDICFTKSNKEEEYAKSNKWDGSYFYDDLNILKIFTSTLNKMKMLDIEDSGYYISSDRYNIRLFLKNINLSPEDVGFDLSQFSDKFYNMLQGIERNTSRRERENKYLVPGKEIGRFYVKDYDSNGIRLGRIKFTSYTDGVFIDSKNKVHMWEENDEFDNKDQYDESIKLIDVYLDKYSKFISYKKEFEEIEPQVMWVRTGLFKKNIKKTYNRYYLIYKIKLEPSS